MQFFKKYGPPALMVVAGITALVLLGPFIPYRQALQHVGTLSVGTLMAFLVVIADELALFCAISVYQRLYRALSNDGDHAACWLLAMWIGVGLVTIALALPHSAVLARIALDDPNLPPEFNLRLVVETLVWLALCALPFLGLLLTLRLAENGARFTKWIKLR